MNLKAELFVDAQANLGEGPVWIDRQLWFVDINGHQIGRVAVDAEGGAGSMESYPVGSTVGALVPRESGGFVLALRHGFASFLPETKDLGSLLHVDGLPDSVRFNDGKCDPRGRFIVGTLGTHDGKPAGALYAIDATFKPQELLRDVSISNGLAWDAEGTTFYYIDTPTAEVAAFDYDLDTATLSNRRTVVKVPSEMGHPDGMTIDRDGNLWIALWDGWGVGCWDPRTGKLLQKIDVPAQNTTCCTFGGRDLDQLFITTARLNRPTEKLENQPDAGGIFVCRPGARGLPPFRFNG